MILTPKQIRQLNDLLNKYPDADSVGIQCRENGSGIGPDDVAVFYDKGNLFRKIAPKVLGEEDITDVDLW
jgi:hypothetical protein